MADNVFFKALEAHTVWKIRLRNYLDGSSQENLDPDVVCLDNQCSLGKWIYSEGQNYQDMGAYEQLRTVHADFHRCAADIIRKADAGQAAEAEQIFRSTYVSLSRNITKLLVSMHSQTKDSDVA